MDQGLLLSESHLFNFFRFNSFCFDPRAESLTTYCSSLPQHVLHMFFQNFYLLYKANISIFHILLSRLVLHIKTNTTQYGNRN